MNSKMIVPSFKDVFIHETEEYQNRVAIHVSLTIKEQACPTCGIRTNKVHNYRMH